MPEPDIYAAALLAATPTLAISEDEDMPILTEVVSPEAADSKGAPLPVDAAQVEALTAEIVESVKRRLSYELSTLLEAVLLNTVEELEAGIAASVETAIRGFMEQKFSSGETDTL